MKITTKFINKFHYEMSFLKKNNLYQLIIIALCISIGYLQAPISPKLYISNKNKDLFYSFENNMLSLYDINISNVYDKIWEYNFLNNKEAELSSILFEDITGNGQQELVLILYTFGAQAEIYIFSTDNMIPNGKPDIYAFPKLKSGTKPSNATMINWDGDKDYEILVSLSSPERKILIFDYNINELQPIEEIGKSFLGSTYGLIDIYTKDINQDQRDDIIIYNNNQQPAKYTLYFNQVPENKQLVAPENIQKIIPILINNELHDIGLTESGNLYSFKDNKLIDNFKLPIKEIISYNNKELILLFDQQIVQVAIPEVAIIDSIILDMPSDMMQCVANKTNHNILCANVLEEAVFLYQFFPTPSSVRLEKGHNNTRLVQKNTSKEQPMSTSNDIPKDTLFVNAGENITINIEKPETIKSIETITRPPQIELDAHSLHFKWDTQPSDIGEHLLEYNITYSTNTVLEKSNTINNQLALNSIETIETSINKHIIYVNDPPKIIIDSVQDTIKFPDEFSVNYEILDNFYSANNTLTTLEPSDLFIDNSSIYWKPKETNAGLNKFRLYINDGIASDTLILSLFVDTTRTNIEHKEDSLIITVNEEFLYQLPHQEGQIYRLIKAPTNMRISAKGRIHWIPIMTQLDNNSIEIKITNNNHNETHTLNVYVNAPPIIAFRPAVYETMTQKDSLIFFCQNFDMNANPTLNWKLSTPNSLDSLTTLNALGVFTVYSDTLLDNFNYSIILSDDINEDVFKGYIYINDPPEITSTPPNYLSLGDTLNYQILVEDKNFQKPFNANKKNIIYYELLNLPQNAIFDTLKRTLIWIPGEHQIGNNNFSIKATDSIATTEQNCSIFINDAPSIISIDSLSIEVGDTLEHFFNANDLNTDSELTYSIKTTIDELLFSGKAGKLTWIPTQLDIGLHTLEINVSDGFSAGSDTQKLKIFVYRKPTLINSPPMEAFVNLEYLYSPTAEDMFGNISVPKDVHFIFSSIDSLFTGIYSTENNELQWTPSLSEIGEIPVRCLIKDQYNHSSIYDYTVNVLLSPCEPSDTLHQLPALIDSILIEKVDTVYIKETKKYNNPDNLKWKPKALGF